jgi:hypothetical protein
MSIYQQYSLGGNYPIEGVYVGLNTRRIAGEKTENKPHCHPPAGAVEKWNGYNDVSWQYLHFLISCSNNGLRA